MFRAALLSASAALLSGCAVYDTGEVDYRRVAVQSPSAAITGCANPCTLQTGYKNRALGSAIQKDQFYSISIDHAVIADMVEPKFAVRRAVQFRNPFRRVGEIVILASVFEFDAGTNSTHGFVDFSDLSDAKVIYYNPDVEAHQHLNFSNIPLLPPSKYGGRPVGVQIFIIELDRMSKPMQGLLSQLADLGWTANIIPTGGAGGLLSKLGKSMLSGAHDDTIFEYRFVLDPDGTGGVSPILESGRYVLVRLQERRNSFDWNSVALDADTGVLRCVSVAGCTATEPYNGATYLVLNVKKHLATAESAIAQKKYGDLLTAIDKAADERDARLADVTTQIKTMTDAATVSALQGRVERTIADAQAAVGNYERALLAAKPSASNPVCASPNLDTQSTEIALKREAARLYDELVEAEKTVGPNGSRVLIGAVGKLFLPMPSGFDANNFVDMTKFKGEYQNGGMLGDKLVAAVRDRVGPCT